MLRLNELSKRYGDVVALDDCSFEVNPGTLLGFLGPNGAGKTTAMRAIFGLIRPDRGEVTWKGAPIDVPTRHRFGYMPEQRGLYPRMKIAAQLAYFGQLHGMGRSDAEASAVRWLDTLGLEDRADAKLEQLSHGNQQRVQLATALVHDPDLLVLDEPFSGLDPLGVRAMADILADRAAGGNAVVFSSHQLDLVEDLCDSVAVINQGRIVLAGRVSQLKAASRYRYLEVEHATPAGVVARGAGRGDRGGGGGAGAGRPHGRPGHRPRGDPARRPSGRHPAGVLVHPAESQPGLRRGGRQVTGSPGALQSSWLVAHREFTERLRSRAYQLSTLITLLLVGGLLVVPTFFDDPTRYEIGLAGSVPDGIEDQVLAGAAEPDTEVALQPMDDVAAVRAGLEEGDIDIGLVDGTTVVTGPDSPPELVTLVTAVAAAESLQAAAEQLDIDSGALGELLSAAPVVEEIEPVDDAEEQRLFLAFIGTLVLFVSIVTYGQWVLQGVVEEKSSRVVEVILGAVQPRHLLGGKVLGIGALGLIQVLLIAGTAFVASQLITPVDLPPITFGVVMTVLVWFVLGFAFYAAGYAVAGSLVSNNEDAQNASFPLTLVLMVGILRLHQRARRGGQRARSDPVDRAAVLPNGHAVAPGGGRSHRLGGGAGDDPDDRRHRGDAPDRRSGLLGRVAPLGGSGQAAGRLPRRRGVTVPTGRGL